MYSHDATNLVQPSHIVDSHSQFRVTQHCYSEPEYFLFALVLSYDFPKDIYPPHHHQIVIFSKPVMYSHDATNLVQSSHVVDSHSQFRITLNCYSEPEYFLFALVLSYEFPKDRFSQNLCTVMHDATNLVQPSHIVDSHS